MCACLFVRVCVCAAGCACVFVCCICGCACVSVKISQNNLEFVVAFMYFICTRILSLFVHAYIYAHILSYFSVSLHQCLDYRNVNESCHRYECVRHISMCQWHKIFFLLRHNCFPSQTYRYKRSTCRYKFSCRYLSVLLSLSCIFFSSLSLVVWCVCMCACLCI